MVVVVVGGSVVVVVLGGSVVVGSGAFQIDNTSNLEFTVTNRVGLANGDTPIAAILVGSCDAD